MTGQRRTKDELFEVLRGEIFAAQIKVILDKELGRPTSDIVKKLAAVKLPPASTKPTTESESQPTATEPRHARTRTRRRYVTAQANGLVKTRSSLRRTEPGTKGNAEPLEFSHAKAI